MVHSLEVSRLIICGENPTHRKATESLDPTGSLHQIIMGSNGKIFAQDDNFWNNYLKGRPRPPDSLFERIFSYHQAHGGTFDTVHDVGAGNGPWSQKLRSKFSHVIVSDIVAKNVQLAQDRLGTDGFSYRAAKMEEADDIPPASVDMVFAANVMHFPDQTAAIEAVARQLKPGGTFVCAGFGAARFVDERLQDLWARISHHGGRLVLQKAEKPEQTIAVLARTQGLYNVAPLSPKLFAPGALRVHLNMGNGGMHVLVPPETEHMVREPNYTGPDDVEIFENEEGWSFDADLEGVKEHILAFPFVSENPAAFKDMFQELEDMLADGRVVQGYWPAKIILATRR
ncbi:S-adenosyl-L-methionine-dependent methyltransferase [Hypoxylon sp. NC1633]|nr:S-adenosyl-L-methionine-dependent methyltransferase [Hypoxylon sp. NC1633]